MVSVVKFWIFVHFGLFLLLFGFKKKKLMKYFKKKLNLKIQAINKDFQLHFQQKIFFFLNSLVLKVIKSDIVKVGKVNTHYKIISIKNAILSCTSIFLRS